MVHIEPVRSPEENSRPMLRFAFRRERRPASIEAGGAQFRGMFGFRLHPALHVAGEALFGQRFAHKNFELSRRRRAGRS